jgi:hypothetical protein
MLVAADAVAFALFATVGLLSHHGGVSAAGYARDLLPLYGGWLVAALALGAYRRGSPARVVAAWAAGVPLGWLVRALVLGRSLNAKEASFLAVALVFTLLFLVLLRGALALAPRQAT